MHESQLYKRSSYVAKMLENVFVAELQIHAWKDRDSTIEVLRSEVDDAGFDLVLVGSGLIRFIQIKQMYGFDKKKSLPVHTRLLTKPNPVILLISHDLSESKDLIYRIYEPNNLDEFPIAVSPKSGNERPEVRSVPCSIFDLLAGINEVYERLFQKVS